MNYTDVKNLKWVDVAHTAIDCEVNFEKLTEGYVHFTASPNDVEAHGVEIFNRCVAGDFGAIEDILVSPCTINKTTILADGVDEAIITNIPVGTTLYALEDGAVTVDDGEFIITSAVKKTIVVVAVSTGYEEYRETIYAT